MDQEEAGEYIQLIDEALELLQEKREHVKQVLEAPEEEKERGDCFKRVEEINLLLEENREQSQRFGDLKNLLR